MTKIANMEVIESPEFKVELSQNLDRVNKLLNGGIQGPEVRRFLWGFKLVDEGYPGWHEIHDSFRLEASILSQIAQITRGTFRDGRERELYIGVRGGTYLFSDVHFGTRDQVYPSGEQLFPKEIGDFALMEVHTHPKLAHLNLPSPEDVAEFIVSQRHVPMMLVSAETGAWLLLKSREFFEEVPPTLVEDVIIKKIKDLDEEYEKKYRTPQELERFMASYLTKYKIFFFSNNTKYQIKTLSGENGKKPLVDIRNGHFWKVWGEV